MFFFVSIKCKMVKQYSRVEIWYSVITIGEKEKEKADF